MAVPNFSSLLWEVRDLQSNALLEDGLILIDVLLEERIRESAEVSKYAAEKGTSRADNHRPENPTISLSCLFLGHPTSTTIGGVKTPDQVKNASGLEDVYAFDILRELKNKSVFLTYTSPKYAFENLLIKDLNKVTNKSTGQAVCQIDIELEQQQLVTLQTVQVKKNKPPTGNSVCQGRKDSGPKTAETVPAEKKQTVTLQAKNKGVDIVKGIAKKFGGG